MEREPDPTIVVEDEAVQDWLPLDLSRLYASTRSHASVDELHDDDQEANPQPRNDIP